MGYDGFAGIGLLALVWFALSLAVTIGIIVLIFLGIRWLIRNTNAGPGGMSRRPAEDPALATLRDRFARGEIDADEYEQRRKLLLGG